MKSLAYLNINNTKTFYNNHYTLVYKKIMSSFHKHWSVIQFVIIHRKWYTELNLDTMGTTAIINYS